MDYTLVQRPVPDFLFNNKAAYIRLVLQFIVSLIRALSTKNTFVYVRLIIYMNSQSFIRICR